MFGSVNHAIESLVQEIHTVDQKGYNSLFVKFLDALDSLLKKLEVMGYQIDLTEEMNAIQAAFEKKDLTELSDYLLYDFKSSMEELEKIVTGQ